MAEGHRRKKRYYADNRELVELASNVLQVSTKNIGVLRSRCVGEEEYGQLNQRRRLRAWELAERYCEELPSGVLKGSYMNFRRFNEITTVADENVGLGGPRA